PLGITFNACRAEELDFAGMFDVIFCNSTFQWLNPPEPVLRCSHRALKKGGRMGIQAPATRTYSPNFMEAVEAVRHDPRTRETFARFRAPWLFFDTAQEYRLLFENAGFDVLRARIEKITTVHTADEVFKVFDSGAAAGYLNPECYDVRLTDGYVEDFRGIVRDSFTRQANREGKVNLTFFRIYLLAQKASGQPSAVG
ncbi:MAG: methyltransferase domain-containing protein, partial [Chloroflexi bacterium]|nr:methyltransferase domain-containing protein [Chloroflexota bacterium]